MYSEMSNITCAFNLESIHLSTTFSETGDLNLGTFQPHTFLYIEPPISQDNIARENLIKKSTMLGYVLITYTPTISTRQK